MTRAESPKRVDVSLLGTPSCSIDRLPPQRLERKVSAAVFLVVSGHGYSREMVAGLLWPMSTAAVARSNMRVMLHRLRKTLGVEIFATGDAWALAPFVQSDLNELLSGSTTHSKAEAALNRPLLAGADYTDLSEFCDLLRQTQERITDRSIQALLEHAEQSLDSGANAEALRVASLVLNYHPTNEAACRAKMRAQVALGDRAGALSTYELCRSEIARLLGTAPDQHTRRLQLDVLRTDRLQPQDLPALSNGRSQMLRSARIVGRESIVSRLLKCAATGRHAWLLGDAGMGKSRVIEELLTRTSAVRLSCRPNDEGAPYAVIKRLIGHLNHAASGEIDTDMASLLAEAAGIGPSLIDLGRVFTATLHALEQLRRDGVQLLIIDDLHYIDMASARIISELCDVAASEQGQSGLPTMLFAARPQHLNPAYADVKRSAEMSWRFERVLLAGLSLDDTLDWLRDIAVPRLNPEACAARLHSLSGGNPFFMLEIVRASRDTDNPNALSMRVDSIIDMLSTRIATASSDAINLANLLAVAGSDFHSRMPLEVLQFSPVHLVTVWHELMHLGIVDAHGFSHDLALSAAQGRLIGSQSQLLHEGVAEFMVRHNASPIRVATHFMAGANPGRCIPHAIAAAKSLWRDGLVAEALELADRAAEFLPSPPYSGDAFELLWCRHHLLIATSAARHRWPQSLSILRQAVSTAKHRIMVDCAEMRMLVDSPDAIARMLEIGARHAETPQTDSSYWREIQCFHALALVLSNRASHAQILYENLRSRATTQETSNARGDFALASWFNPILAITACALGHTDEAVDRMVQDVSDADAQALPLLQYRSRYRLAETYAYQGRVPLAIATLCEAREAASRRGMPPSARCVVDALHARLAISWGALDEARDLIDVLRNQCHESLPPGWRTMIEMLWNHACGNTQEARTHADSLRASSPPTWIGFGKLMECLTVAMRCSEGNDPSDIIERGLTTSGADASHSHSFLRLMRCRYLAAKKAYAESLDLAQLARHTGLRGHELAALTEMACSSSRLGRPEEARTHMDGALRLWDEAAPLAVTRIDQARRMFEIMCACHHPAAEPWRERWREWRNTMCKALAPLDQHRFFKRHAWVDD